ncbi:MAG: iron permease, partial [Bifidobacterium sp.]
AAILLVCIFLLIRFTSVRIPIRPFFVITSALMAIMVVIFAGGGVHALIEGDLIPATYYPSVPTNDWLGLYPYAQTIAAQIIAIIAVVTLLAISVIRSRRADGNRVGTADSVSMAEPAASTGSNDLTDR